MVNAVFLFNISMPLIMLNQTKLFWDQCSFNNMSLIGSTLIFSHQIHLRLLLWYYLRLVLLLVLISVPQVLLLDLIPSLLYKTLIKKYMLILKMICLQLSEVTWVFKEEASLLSQFQGTMFKLGLKIVSKNLPVVDMQVVIAP